MGFAKVIWEPYPYCDIILTEVDERFKRIEWEMLALLEIAEHRIKRAWETREDNICSGFKAAPSETSSNDFRQQTWYDLGHPKKKIPDSQIHKVSGKESKSQKGWATWELNEIVQRKEQKGGYWNELDQSAKCAGEKYLPVSNTKGFVVFVWPNLPEYNRMHVAERSAAVSKVKNIKVYDRSTLDNVCEYLITLVHEITGRYEIAGPKSSDTRKIWP
jgi:hypothetical protein